MADKVAFMIADYHFVLTGNINQNPMQESILKTLGSLRGLWEDLVHVAEDECSFVADSSFNPYVFPNRTITFRKRKKSICKFEITADRLHIHLPLTFEIAKTLVEKRTALPGSINESIHHFGCINCGKCANQSNIVSV